MRIKRNHGITLIALVITIIILIIIAGVSISVLVNRDGLINKSIDAKEQYVVSEITEKLNLYGLAKQTENLGKIEIDEYLDYISTKNEYTIDVEDNDENTDFAKYLLVNDVYEFLVEEKGDGSYIYVEYLGKIGERDGLVLSEYEGEIFYPNNGTFRITKNASKGELSVVSSNPEVAVVSLDEKTVTITPQILSKKQEEVTITVVSAGKGVQQDLVAEYKAIIKQGKIEVLSTGYNGVYDGLEHGINVEVNPVEANIVYSEDGISYDLDEAPKYKEAGTYTTYYKASLPGYTTISGAKEVTIGKKVVNLDLSKTSGVIKYPNQDVITVTKNYDDAQWIVESLNQEVANASIDGNTLTIIPQAVSQTETATIRIKVPETEAFYEAYIDYTVTVEQGDLSVNVAGYNGNYDGLEHGINVIVSPENANVVYSEDGENYNLTEPPKFVDAGTYTTYYQISLQGYKTINGNEKVIIGKREMTLNLSENSATIKYPNEKVITVNTNNADVPLSVESLDTSVATATIEGNVVTIIPSAVNSTKTATIRVTAEESVNNFATYTDFEITVEQGDLDVRVEAFFGNYDGSEHGITVTVIPEEATVLYSEDGENYNLTEPPKYTDVTTRTTYFMASLDGYKTVSNSSTVTINKIRDAQAPVAATIQMSGETSITSLPATIYATVTHEDEAGTATTEGSGIDISRCKYVLNTTSGKIGTDPNSYTNTFSSNGEKVSLTLSESGTSYYLHVLSVDNEGNMNETVKGPMKVTANYHTHVSSCYTPTYHYHSGSSSSGGGCYGSPNYHSHTSSCYRTNYHSHSSSCYNYTYHSHSSSCYNYTYHSHTSSCYNYTYHSHVSSCYNYTYHSHTGSESSGTGCYAGGTKTTTRHKHSNANGCYTTVYGTHSWDPNASMHDSGNTVVMAMRCSVECSKNGREYDYYAGLPSCPGVKKLTCKKSTKATTTYALNCGKTTSTVESQTLKCGKTTSTVESSTLKCGKTTSTVESSTLKCGKTTSTVESSTLKCGKTTSTAESTSLICGKSTSSIVSYSLNCGYSNGQQVGSTLSCGKSTSTIIGYTVSY